MRPTVLRSGPYRFFEKGPSLQDQRHRLVLSGAYTMPGGISVSSIVTLASGRPFNVLAGADLQNLHLRFKSGRRLQTSHATAGRIPDLQTARRYV